MYCPITVPYENPQSLNTMSKVNRKPIVKNLTVDASIFSFDNAGKKIDIPYDKLRT